MNSTTQSILSQITEKLNWGKRALLRIQNNHNNREEIQDNFWSFLTAFQQAWFYYGRWIEINYPELTDKSRREKSKEIIENWKNSALSAEEKEAWDLLQAIRNHDTHKEPVMPEVTEEFRIFTNSQGFILTNSHGQKLGTKIINYLVEFQGNKHDIIKLSNYGINAVQKLLIFIPTIIK